jgi:O-antigen/teichoic acid export membrane protein
MSVILARLLTPTEYGLIGMVALFFALASAVGDAGFGAALIQRKHVDPDDEASVLALNVVTGTVLTLVICAISPAVSIYFRQPVLTLVLCVLATQIFFNSFGLVQVALLTRHLDFRTQAIVSIAATFISGVLGIAVAWAGGGVWSLVVQAVSRSFFRSLLLWSLAAWRPRGRFSWPSIRGLWGFSSPLLAAGLIDTIFTNIYSVVLGRMSTADFVGKYTTANQMQQAPSSTAGGILGSVLLPHFSRQQENPALLKAQFRKSLRILAALMFPTMLGMCAMAHNMVVSLITEKWVGCVPILRILSIVGLLYPLHVLHLCLLKAIGRTDLILRLEVVKKLVIAALIAATWNIGPIAVVWGILVSSVIAYVINSYYTRRIIGYSWLEQFKDLLPSFALTVLAVAPAWYVDTSAGGDARWRFLAEIAMASIIGIALGWVFGKRLFGDLHAFIKSSLGATARGSFAG